LEILEFHDLWHSLKVPNEVDLLKQLASGMKLAVILVSTLNNMCNRGLASYCSRSSYAKGTNDEEER
jgi:hypothetical protein